MNVDTLARLRTLLWPGNALVCIYKC